MPELAYVSRVTIYADKGMEGMLLEQVLALGAKGYTATDCTGVGQHGASPDPFLSSTQVRIEVITQPGPAKRILDYIKSLDGRPVTACVEPVQVFNSAHF